MFYQCDIVDQSVQTTLAIRARTSVQELPQEIGRAYGAIMQYLSELGEYPVGAPYAAYHNMDMQDLDVEMGFPVSRKLPDHGEIRASEIPAGRFGVCLYTGPYEEIGPGAYDALTDFIRRSGYKPTGVAYEIYLNDPAEVAPQDLQTRVMFPLETS